MGRHGRRLLATLVVALAVVPAATGSELIDRDATGVTLSVNVKGEALLNYRVGGKARHVLAWGAVNAIPPTKARRQVEFKLDYAGGWGKYRKQYWKTFGNACGAYDGPPLAWKVLACKASDGSYWAIQSWQRMLPNLGLDPEPAQAAWELRLSHWTGALPELAIVTDWAYRRYDHLFGTFTYGGTGVFGYKSTPAGAPLDTFGRNIYLDTFDSTYGKGWKRENGFLTHTGTAVFCYGVFPNQNNGGRPAGAGTKYRATAIGPGVTPDVMWQGAEPGPYSKDADATMNAAIEALGDPQCKPN